MFFLSWNTHFEYQEIFVLVNFAVLFIVMTIQNLPFFFQNVFIYVIKFE